MRKELKLILEMNEKLTNLTLEHHKLAMKHNELINDYELEKDLKNQAYYFILDNKLLNEFDEYVKNNPTGQDHDNKIKSIFFKHELN